MLSPHDFYVVLSAIAGAVTALFFMPWKDMGWLERAATVIVGTCFAIFGSPLLLQLLPESMYPKTGGENLTSGVTYFSAVMSHTVLPIIMNKWKKKTETALGVEGS